MQVANLAAGKEAAGDVVREPAADVFDVELPAAYTQGRIDG